jgi:hypothetical protein
MENAMQSLFEQITSIASQYWSVLIGFLVVGAYARERFNEPTFPSRETLPRTVAPLRYLFLGSTYERARRTYVIGSLLLYAMLLVPGQSIAALGIDPKTLPPQAWALAVALFLVGLLPAAKVKWITMLEESLRRRVHELFLVPTGVTRTIGMLEDAPYKPPLSQLEALPEGQKEKIEADLRLRRSSLRYRWARATMLMASLNQMGAGADHALQQTSFEPFRDDFDAISNRHRSLAQDMPSPGKTIPEEKEAALKVSVDALLRRIYAYISWGVRQQAKSEAAMVETLEALGFSITILQGRRLFDIVAPAAGSMALITSIFWLGYDAIVTGDLWTTTSHVVLMALTSATAAAIMYGWAASIALKHRGLQIEERTWRAGSPKCLITIAWRAGLISCAVIIGTTFVWRQADVLQSLSALLRWDRSAMISAGPGRGDIAAMDFLFVKIATAVPWLLAGATASAALAFRMGGDVRRTDKRQRIRDAVWLGSALGIAVLLAQLLQSAIGEQLDDVDRVPIRLVFVLGLVGAVCGAVLGLMVPYACRANVVTPPDPSMVRKLRDWLARAEVSLGSRDAAFEWVFSPHNGLRGITPAEAIQYEGYENAVRQLLDSERSADDARDGPIALATASRLQSVDAA